MSNLMTHRLARLRGTLPAEEPGARGLERVARNPACQRLRALVMAGITPATAMEKVYNEIADEFQSPFALGVGNQFERHVFDSGAARLLDMYRNAGRLMPSECKVMVVPDVAAGTGPIAMAQRRTMTHRLLLRKLQGDPTAPNLIIKPRILVAFLGIEHMIEPDALVAADEEPFYRVVEIKSYSDRGGKTNTADLRSAARQAAVGVMGLHNTLSRLGYFDPSDLIPPIGDLVLRRPGSLFPTLSTLTLHGELHSLQRVCREAPRDLRELEALLDAISPSASLDNPAILDAVPNNLVESCAEHCPLAKRCKAQAITSGSPVLLGGQAQEELAAAGSIGRALDLLRGRGTAPMTSEEQALQERLREVTFILERAANG